MESPYKIRDIGIQVMVEPPVADDVASMPVELKDDIEQILATIIRTSIDKEAARELTDVEMNEKIAISVQPFNGKNYQSSYATTNHSLVGLCCRWSAVSNNVVFVLCLFVTVVQKARH